MTVEPRPRNKYSPANKSAKKTGLVLVHYADHVLFRKTDLASIRVAHRETAGWIVHQDEESITIVHDRNAALEVDRYKDRTSSCGLVLLRAAIEGIQEIDSHG